MAVPQVAIDAVTHYLGKGLSKEISVGIVSVLYAESGLNPGSQGTQPTEHGGSLNPHGAYGIASWNGVRQDKLAAYAQKKNLPVGDLNTQLDFVLTESANDYQDVWAAIQAQTMSYSDFIPLFVKVYENPADPAAESNRAITFANALYPAVPAYTPQAPAPAPTPAPAPAPTPFPKVSEVAFIADLLSLMQKYGVTFS